MPAQGLALMQGCPRTKKGLPVLGCRACLACLAEFRMVDTPSQPHYTFASAGSSMVAAVERRFS
jgi:hypothetical protein